MSLSEKILLRLSRAPQAADYQAVEMWHDGNALAHLLSVFPDALAMIQGKRVLDFGSGEGWQVVELAKAGARHVLGIDISETGLAAGRELARAAGMAEKTEFCTSLQPQHLGSYDIVLSQNSMEHFADPDLILRQMASALRPDGVILITFSPPWYAPYGSHMHFFTKVPWVNILFSERTVMNVRSRFRQDGAARYEDVEGGLNRMSLAKFERTLAASGLRIVRKQYRCVKGLDALGAVPLLRELFVNQVNCVLTRV